ncbi:ECF-type sigma factor [Cerasicoccus frondis]|uniref:ECF-type sigma factor n=1 Tax=Cerasicoccus frondis TaxID=490090 RepID=UPI002852A93D|nr:ECF-type sigma factor [Cerasicoccus frondis]
MSESSREGGLRSTDSLFPQLYEELRRLAAYKLKYSNNQTLSGTALLHEAYIRMRKEGSEPKWRSEREFYSVAAEAMRRIIIDRIRAKKSLKRGGEFERVDFSDDGFQEITNDPRLENINEALDALERVDRSVADVVKLRFFVGLSMEEIALANGVSARTVQRQWAYAKAWLSRKISMLV